jgi:hypothetical protein
MQKRLGAAGKQDQAPPSNWFDLERMAEVELTSEDAAHPIESALVADANVGWRAAEPGEQRILLLFHEPQRLLRILLRFVEAAAERTQEFTLRWSADGGRSFRELVRQQYTFSPRGATTEIEDFRVDLPGVTALELTIVPDQGRGEAYASLAEWRLA